MRIRHFMGYGSVHAKKVSCNAKELVVHVWGHHEYGIVREDECDVFNWLVRRFDKTRKDYREIERVEIEEWWEPETEGEYLGAATDHCRYTIRFRKRISGT